MHMRLKTPSESKESLLCLASFASFFSVISIITNLILFGAIHERKYLIRTLLDVPLYLCLLLPIFLLKERMRNFYTKSIVFLLLAQFVVDISCIGTIGTKPDTGTAQILATTSLLEIKQYLGSILSFSTILSFILVSAAFGISFFTLSKYLCSRTNFTKTPRFSISVIGLVWMLYALVTVVPLTTIPAASAMPSSQFQASLQNVIKDWSPLQIFTIPRFIRAGYVVRNSKNELIEIHKNPKFPNAITRKQDAILGLVIIGESATRNHHSLYGYERNTNPRLAGETNIVLFDDIISTCTLTECSIRDSYCLKGNEIQSTAADIFSAAGFDVHYMSAQSLFTSINAPLRILFSKAHPSSLKYDFTDGAIPSAVKSVKNLRLGNVILFLHLVGSHQPYERRYPHNIGSFRDVTSAFPREYNRLSLSQKDILNSYDNSIEYSDRIISEVIEHVKSLNRTSFIVYYSDHGEVPYNNTCYFRADIEHYPQLVEIPFFIWFSDKYKKKFPEVVKAAENNRHQPFQTHDLSYTLFDLCQIRFEKFPYEKSLVSQKLVPQTKRYCYHSSHLEKVIYKR